MSPVETEAEEKAVEIQVSRWRKNPKQRSQRQQRLRLRVLRLKKRSVTSPNRHITFFLQTKEGGDFDALLNAEAAVRMCVDVFQPVSGACRSQCLDLRRLWMISLPI